MKYAIRYHRFSKDDQSVGSLERQATVTGHWCTNNEIAILDTFEDDGWSAKNFDRPDLQKLLAFIKKQSSKIDYLIVSELTRFSRELGDAINIVTKIQKEYGIRIVSSGRNIIYDCTDATSFFMMSIEFTLGKTENLKRESDINGGIYTAKAVDGRYINPRKTFGYTIAGKGKDRHIVINATEASIVSYIYSSFLQNRPIVEIGKEARLRGYKSRANMAIHKILTNPLYSGQQMVKGWRDMPGGLMPGKHEAIIDAITWQQVQQKFIKKDKIKVTVIDELPLKGILHCHCGKLLTGAPSRSRNGNYYYYYKCQLTSKHNNISAVKAHNQMQSILQYLSIPEHLVSHIKETTLDGLQLKRAADAKTLTNKTKELADSKRKLISLEEKFIANQVAFETYQRWFTDLQQKIVYLQASIANLKGTEIEYEELLNNELYNLTDLQYHYNQSTVIDKQNLLNIVFDRKLYYLSNIYRTGFLMPIFTHNTLILKQKQLLILDEKKSFGEKSSIVENELLQSNHLQELLNLFHQIKVA